MPEGPSPAREISASITTLLVYTFAHSTRHLKVIKFCCHLRKSRQKLQNSDFQSQFSNSKMIRIFLIFFQRNKIYFRATFFVIDSFRQLQFLQQFIS